MLDFPDYYNHFVDYLNPVSLIKPVPLHCAVLTHSVFANSSKPELVDHRTAPHPTPIGNIDDNYFELN